MDAAEEALRALARDLVEELAAGRALELAREVPGDVLGLATYPVRPFSRQERTKSGQVITEQVHGHTASRNGPGGIPEDDWRQGQQSWEGKGQAIWAADRWKDIDPAASARFSRHVDAASQHLAPDRDSPDLARGYEALHEAHRVATEQLLPRAETPEQKESVRAGIGHLRDRMKDIDQAAGVKPTRTSRLTGAVPERAARAAEKLAEPAHPAVRPVPPEMPPPPKGAQAVHPGLGGHLARMPGSTVSQHELKAAVLPMPQEPASPEGVALEAANKRLEGYAQREDRQRAADLRDHLAELRAAQARQQGIAAEGEYAPLTDEQFAAHTQEVEAKLEQALRGGHATWQRYTENGDGVTWTGQRAILHAEVLHDFMDKQVDVPSRREVLFLGGLSGAGKTTLMKDQLKDYAVVNPDDFKEELVRRGAAPGVEGLSPMEASTLVHEESVYLANVAAEMLSDRGKNMAWDATMNNRQNVTDWLDYLKHPDSGYTARGVFVDVPVQVSADRAMSRYRRELEAYRSGKSEFGGRYIPRYAILQGEVEPGVSRARRNFDRLKGQFSHWAVYDGTGDTGKPVASGGSGQAGHGIPSVEELRRQVSGYTGSTEPAAQAAEHGGATEAATRAAEKGQQP